LVWNEAYSSRSDVEKRSVTDDYIGIYQRFIGGIRGHECPMYPSCSNYGLNTFKETNFLHAFALTSDRMLRCGHDHQYYSLTLTQGGFRYLDFSALECAPKDLIYTRNHYSFYYADTIPDEYSFKFISTLMNGQYHREALMEMMRLEYSKGILPIELFINKVICLKSLGDYESAIFEYENKCPIDYKSNVELIYQMALVYYQLENYKQAQALLSEIMEFDYDPYAKSKAIMLNALLCAQSDDWQQCQAAYARLEGLD
jgi:putative component of membrane protein insertase Oxa1/YidC/SpoIIIJ protein YidD